MATATKTAKPAAKKPAAKKPAAKTKLDKKASAAVANIQSKFPRCKAISTSPDAMHLLEGLAAQLSSEREDRLHKVPYVLSSKNTLAQSTIKDGVLLGSLKALRSEGKPRFNVCRITHTGHFCCCDQHGRLCSKTKPGPCKHLAAVLTRAVIDKHIDARTLLRWTERSMRIKPDTDKGPLLELLLSPLQSEAFDWRPNEIIAEDTYAE